MKLSDFDNFRTILPFGGYYAKNENKQRGGQAF